jgi:hypothetical protein
MFLPVFAASSVAARAKSIHNAIAAGSAMIVSKNKRMPVRCRMFVMAYAGAPLLA